MRYYIINSCSVELWGVSQQERIAKTLARAGEFECIHNLDDLVENENILLLRADYLYEANVIAKLITRPQAILPSSSKHAPVAAWVDSSAAINISQSLVQSKFEQEKIAIPAYTAEDLTGGYDPRLRKFDLSHVVKLTEENKIRLENYLYDKSYKGITDLVTKWCWPMPARWTARKCAHKKITPNQVTGFGWLLTLIAGIAFYFGEFAIGLVAAWIMTFLDTVDGKLARVTLQSSKIGHAMDHGLDIIHPPIWYGCWALGLGLAQISFFGLTLSTWDWIWVMLVAYIAGRVFEGLFQLFFNDISIFCWQPLDSYHRLITARRNPCMIMLTVAILFFNPILGFIWVVFWTVLSSVALGVRFITAMIARISDGPLVSWIETVDPEDSHLTMSVKLFTGYPAQKTIAPLLHSSD